jgi:hypothetical protein
MTNMMTKAALGLALLVAPGVAEGQTVTNSGVSGTLMSASVDVPAGETRTVFVIPPGKSFVLTTFCLRRTFLASREIGAIAGGVGSTLIPPCFNVLPGIALPPDDELTCSNSGGSGDGDCLISGVHSR